MGYGYPPQEQETMERKAHEHMLGLMKQGRYCTPVSKVIGFDQIPDTLRDFVERKVVGRVVARIG